LIDQPLDAFELYAGNDGANVDGFVEWRTDSQSVHAVLNLADKFFLRCSPASVNANQRNKPALG